MDRLGSDSALRAQPYELSVESALPPAQVDRLLERTPEVTAVARIREIVLTARDKTEIHARVLDGPLGAFPYAIPDGRAARAPGEVTLGRGALDALHARVGDDVTLQVAGHPVALHVVGRHVEPDDDGRGAVTALASLPPGAAKLDDPYWGVRLAQGRGPGGGRRGAAARRERADRGRAPDRVAAARGRRHAPGRLRHGRAADRDRRAQPADHARAGDPRARARLRRARLGRRHAAPGAGHGDRRRRGARASRPRCSGCRSARGSSCS